ncbi:Imidazole glycerol phosphate synthase subunit HisH [Geodia barretti]|uniref:Imidazole glycerol phosphate synthase subunit HisH n=1 Tax=Geodia barretti TaxID=519541 RepID=A0AA35X8X1_GEOBA|nr:Imidazole glycerol phosphate synthase subunit HisH [Geodia barretti]
MKLVVVDYESGNLRSVSRALETCGVAPLVTCDPDELAEADAVVLPGVGAGPSAMNALNERGLVQPLRDFTASGRPFLGICLGLQLLLDWTAEEPGASCLGIVPGQVIRLPDEQNDKSLKIPHMGWNSVALSQEHPAFCGIESGSYFYFVHSFYADPQDREGVVGTTEYGLPFCSAYAKDNVVATQFHPEKSGPVGLRIYRNFVAMAAGGY